MAVTTFATTAQVQQRLDIATGTDSALIGQILKEVTSKMAGYCNRSVGATNLMLRQSSYTELTQGDGGRVIQLSLWPIESITSCTYGGLTLDFSSGTAFTENVDYVVDKDTGLVSSLWWNWPGYAPGQTPTWIGYKNCLQFVYTGGYVDPDSTPSTGQYALPDEIVGACIEECAYRYRTRASIGMQSVNQFGGVSFVAPAGLLQSTRDVLDSFKRWTI